MKYIEKKHVKASGSLPKVSFALFLLTSILSNGQTRNCWLINPYHALHFDSVVVKAQPFVAFGGDITSISDSLGEMVFYTSQDTIYNANKAPLANGFTKPCNIKKSICLDYGLKKYALVTQGNSFPTPGYSFSPVRIYYIDMMYNNGQGQVVDIDSSISGRYYLHDVIFSSKSKQHLLAFKNTINPGDSSRIYIGRIDILGKPELTDSILTVRNESTNYSVYDMIFNNGSNSITNLDHDSNYIYTYHFDQVSLKFTSI